MLHHGLPVMSGTESFTFLYLFSILSNVYEVLKLVFNLTELLSSATFYFYFKESKEYTLIPHLFPKLKNLLKFYLLLKIIKLGRIN